MGQHRFLKRVFDDDPKTLQAKVTAANNLGHQALAQLSKLDNRYKDKQEITHNGPMVIGWDVQKPEPAKLIPDATLDELVSKDIAN